MKDKFKLSIFWIFSFLVIIFMMAFSSHAQDNNLPFIVANDNIDGFEDFIYALPQASNSNQVFLNAYQSGEYFGYDYYENGTHKYAFYVPQEEFIYSFYLSNSYYDFDITTDYVEMTFSNFIYVSGYTVPAPRGGYYFYGSRQINTVSTPLTVRFFYGSSKGDGSLLVPNIASQNYNYELNIYQPVFGLSVVNPPNIGHAIVPPSPIMPDYPDGVTQPTQVPPSFTPTDYDWTTQPTFDSSTVTNAIGSIQNTLGWIANNLHLELKNLTDNGKHFVDYIGKTIQYYGDALLSTLNNFIQNFYDNMANLVQPIFDKINYITTPLEADVIWDNISVTSLITNYSSIINAASSLKSSFENLSEPSEYKIPIHLENISTFGTLTTQYIDLSVINPVKTIIRTFMWALITYSLVVTIIDSIANYINGGGDES